MQKSKISSQDNLEIQLNQNLAKKLGLIHIKNERLKKKKISTYIYFSISITIGVLLILSQRDLLVGFDFTYSKYLKFAQSFLVVILGFGFCSIAINKLKKYQKEIKTLKEEKEKVDSVLNRHQIKYNYNIKFGKKYHGIQDVIVELKSNSNLLKDSKDTILKTV